MTTLTKFTILAFATLCIGCAPSGGEQSEENTTPTNTVSENQSTNSAEISSTKELVASESFDFKSDRMITLSFEQFPSSYGKFVIYSQYDFYDTQLDTYYPNYSTRLASFIATPNLDYDIIIPSTQQFLVLEWLPMDGKSNESYQLLALNEQQSYAANF
ncbi:hypothetical protein A3742_12835 [Oleiphilus sp. HI0071]|uniref:hypothetical protein n=1 Tax=unclassified Oleiphilus TaxID=2631174 RepID=UPI0007C36F60|nr:MULTISPECIES: hypothetical protein [unclassified Oleiphilus]KZY66508.1 hypothetical protein A3737_34855 [Oleiphilus sp. HI0065]KZY80352.1 hypothetical protein A3742_12835 [Oleiphilus sp. HI0071]KZZ06101.1 hypothetical protein A3744_07430 [Oleiphilus sp. HI0073]KZZ40180.1 hypothetical protein A3758_09935 [Oleiphilus sp. HI0118]KZZ51914.1 hypothetical protein A3760_11150 [Oleiphilus sp. HI0122]KZZ65305.1 hypothetical protein A3765_20360 [Oleiphilus sp. HI0130]KZZ73613.1 hypothetical protein